MKIFLAIALIVIFGLITYVAIKFKEISKEVDEEIEKKVEEFEYILKNNKDKYIEHLMKNIRVLQEYNHFDNKIDYRIIFVNEYVVKEKGE